MIKKLLFLFTLIGFLVSANSQTIPRWKIEDVVNSYSAKNDTVYVVNFWATFCKPCNEEIPEFIRIAEKYKSQKVKLLLVSVDLPSYVAFKLPAFIKKNNYKTNHVWLNETNADHFCPMIDNKWSGAIPATIIVNNQTGYSNFTEGEMSAEEFESMVKEAIGGQAMHKYVAPMNDAEVVPAGTSGAAIVQTEYIKFKSSDSSVYSIVNGKVVMVARIDDMKVVIVTDEENKLFYTYSNLGSTVIKKGDLVKKDQLIGYATLDLDGNGPICEFYLSNVKENLLLTKENFTARKDKRHEDHSIDPVIAPMKIQKNN